MHRVNCIHCGEPQGRTSSYQRPYVATYFWHHHEAEVLFRAVANMRQDFSISGNVYPIYTKQGGDGGIFIGEYYNPYINSLSIKELEVLCELHEMAGGLQKKILSQILRKYGPDKLDI